MKVAVIGAGRMGRTRALAARRLGARILAICDSDRERANALTKEFDGAESFTDFQQIAWDSLDAVFICTPPSAHNNAAIRAIEATVHLFIEKPVGLCALDGDTLLLALERSNVVAAVGYMNRYRPAVQQVRQAVAGQHILGVSVNWTCGKYAVPWWSDPVQSGGPLNEQCTHVIDLCRYLVGDVIAVQVLTQPPGRAQEAESAVLNLRFASGALGSVLYSCEALKKMISVGVFTTQREYWLEGWDMRLADQKPMAADKNDIFTVETESFFDAIRQSNVSGDEVRQKACRATAVLSDLHDAVETQRVVDMVFRATKSSDGLASK